LGILDEYEKYILLIEKISNSYRRTYLEEKMGRDIETSI